MPTLDNFIGAPFTTDNYKAVSDVETPCHCGKLLVSKRHHGHSSMLLTALVYRYHGGIDPLPLVIQSNHGSDSMLLINH